MKVGRKIGITFRWGATHKKGGRLISRHTSLDPPKITCPKWACLYRWPTVATLYFLLSVYHKERVMYAEKYPDRNITWKYRTGENPPDGVWSGIWEIIKLKIRRKITWLKTKL